MVVPEFQFTCGPLDLFNYFANKLTALIAFVRVTRQTETQLIRRLRRCRFGLLMLPV